MANQTARTPIPRPGGVPFLGNALRVDANAPLQSLMELAREHGPILRMDMAGKQNIVVSGAELVAELCDESRFDKAVRGALRRLRAVAGDALFTADTQAPNWSKAHNILMPTFSRGAMVDYLPMMIDIAEQLMLKWQRLNADDEIDVVRDMTGLALDTIGLCGFDYRFNSFYRENFHPFIDALTRTLETSTQRRGLPFEKLVIRDRLRQLETDVDFMNTLVDDIIRERRSGGAKDKADLLSYMLKGVDKLSGEGLSDENIRYQINTFLIAGHETTSGLLSFTVYYLLKRPDLLAKAREEVDRVLGSDLATPPSQAQLNQMVFVRAILMEALRLWPTAPVFSVYPYQDETLGGKYSLPKGSFITVLTLMLHRDPTVWGDDADRFDPDNFLGEAEATRPASAYKPFGNGQRACIGRQFALQEATLVTAMILQRFELINHTDYQLVVKETGSIKPGGLRIQVKSRPDIGRGKLAPAAHARPIAEVASEARRPSHGTPLHVLYGSNMGSTETFAREIAQSGEVNGFKTTLAPLDDYVGQLPTDGAVIIASASYNGNPPDNAANFVAGLKTAEPDSARGVSYAVLGCGNRDWASTFQAVPRMIDERLAALGATRIRDRGEADAREDLDGQFQAWFAELWPSVGEALALDIDFTAPAAAQPLFHVEVVKGIAAHPVANRAGAVPMTILENRELRARDDSSPSSRSSRSTRHIEIELPEGMTYQPGDHLCIVPVNRPEVVERAMSRFGFDDDSFVRILATGGRQSPFPSDAAVSVKRLADGYGELQAVASRKDIELMASHTQCPNTKQALEALAATETEGENRYRSQVLLKHKSALDLLDEFPACELPFAAFLEMIPWISPRYYSVSSSPKADSSRCSITVAVVDGPARSGRGQYRGVCSTYLAASRVGDVVHAVVKPPSNDFRPPEDPQHPMLMIGPGTGVAPFRGFLQERRALQDQGTDLGPAMLFFGCRHPEQDFLYQSELEAAHADGLVELYAAFSRLGPERVYVQDLMRKEREKVWELIEDGATVYVCGDGAGMEPDVKRALTTLYAEQKDVEFGEAVAWMEALAENGRYVLDVWAG